MKKTILKIGGMTCSACSIGLEKYLNKQKGIINASVNLVLNQALIEYEDFLTIKDLEKFIKEAGYVSLGIYDGKDEVKNKGKTSLIIFSILALIVLYVAMGHMLKISVFYFDMVKNPKNYAVLLFVLAILFLIYGKDIFKSGIKNLLHGSPNMDSLVSLGVIASFGYSFYGLVLLLINKGNVENLYFESCSIIIYFIKLGRYIDGISKEKTKSALKELVSITPRTALLKNEKKEEEVTIDLVKKGDILICKAGMKIACDGKVTKGSAYVDQAFITGEAEPIKKNIGDDVIAGSINMDGYIEYEALKVGKDSTISEIVRLVVEATNTKAPIQRIADKVSSYFVYFIMVIALVTLFIYLLLGNSFGDSLVIFVSVLVVACPCSLGLATPLAMVVSEGVCAKEGILVKSSEVLENANKIDTVVFDKTGTLTYGFLKIFKIFNYSNLSLNELLGLVASIEELSTHPIASAFKNYSLDNKLKLEKVSDFENLNGIGLKGKINGKVIYVGNDKLFDFVTIKDKKEADFDWLVKQRCSIVYVIYDNELIGLIGLKDVIRKEALAVIKKLKELKIKPIMLTGDNYDTAKVIADNIGIDEVIADVLPKDKAKVIDDLQKDGKKVMMVGDGINDAISLTKAFIGVSVKSGTDVAIDSCDIVLMSNDLEKILSLINISNKTIKNIKENLFWAFFYNICMIPVAVGILRGVGIVLNPMLASLAMMFSSLTVVFNALRLRRIK